MGLSMYVSLTVTLYMGLIILLPGTRSTSEATTNIPTISSSNTDISGRATLSNTIEATMTLSTLATTRISTSNTHLFVINLNTSCVTGQLSVNRSQFNETQSSKDINGTCEGDTEYIQTFLDQLINGLKLTTTAAPSTATTPSLTTTLLATTTNPLTTSEPTTSATSDYHFTGSSETSTSSDVNSTSSTTTTLDTTSTKSCEEHLLRGIGIGAAAVALPFTIILLLCIFRPSICSNGRSKKPDDASGTGNTESEVCRQRLHDDRNSSTSVGAGRDMEAETEVSRPGYGNAGFPNSDLDTIPALPRKTSIFSIHEDDEDILGNKFHSFMPEARSAPESDYDKLPIARKSLETTATGASDDGDDQPEYVNVLEARDGHNQNDQEEYSNFPAISI